MSVSPPHQEEGDHEERMEEAPETKESQKLFGLKTLSLFLANIVSLPRAGKDEKPTLLQDQ